MTIIMLIMMFTLLLLLASQGSLALVPEGMWHNNNNNIITVCIDDHLWYVHEYTLGQMNSRTVFLQSYICTGLKPRGPPSCNASDSVSVLGQATMIYSTRRHGM